MVRLFTNLTVIAFITISMLRCDASFGITGKITDTDQKPLRGVTVKIVGTRDDSAISDETGAYSLSFVDSGSAKCSDFKEEISASLTGYSEYKSNVDLCKETHDITLSK